MGAYPANVEGRSADEAAGPAILCENLVKIYKVADLEVVALQGLDLEVGRGRAVAIVGASGLAASPRCSRSWSGLDLPSAGVARVAGRDLTEHVHQGPPSLPPPHRGLPLPAGDRQPAALPQRGRERAAADDVRLLVVLRAGGPGRRDARGARASPSAPTGSSGEPPEGSSSAWRSGWPWPTGRGSCSPTSPPASSTAAAATRCSEPSATANESFGTTVVVVTHDAHVSEQVSRTVGIRDGRTSSEVRRRTAVDEHGVEGVVAEEFAVLDRAGRLQLPRGFTDALAMRDGACAWTLEARPHRGLADGRHGRWRAGEAPA